MNVKVRGPQVKVVLIKVRDVALEAVPEDQARDLHKVLVLSFKADIRLTFPIGVQEPTTKPMLGNNGFIIVLE
ncbi:hypothetical protein ACD578_08930 [Microvirga sp. RSM25]|uniref:hypothetical protein n=1 Tax=Microvirga sp. RSM25 TaxID=3273802 RepID=UPI00384AA3F8